MADLDNLPRIDPPLIEATPVEGLADFGPEWIDAETVEALGAQMEAGLVQLPPEAGGVIAAVSQEFLEQLFAQNLARPVLSASTPLPHRVLALATAIQAACKAHQSGVSGDAPLSPSGMQMRRAIGNVELYLASKRIVLAQVMPDAPDELLDVLLGELAMIDPATAANVTSITVQQFAAMRSAGVGPAYVKLPRTRNAIRYPLVAMIEWMREVTA